MRHRWTHTSYESRQSMQQINLPNLPTPQPTLPHAPTQPSQPSKLVTIKALSKRLLLLYQIGKKHQGTPLVHDREDKVKESISYSHDRMHGQYFLTWKLYMCLGYTKTKLWNKCANSLIMNMQCTSYYNVKYLHYDIYLKSTLLTLIILF